jgi:hypothetical protein
MELEGLYRTPKIPTTIRRKPRRKTVGFGVLAPEEDFFVFLNSLFPELCLLKGTLPEKCS